MDELKFIKWSTCPIFPKTQACIIILFIEPNSLTVSVITY